MGNNMAQVVFGSLTGVLGFYDHTAATIHVDRGLTRAERASTIAHEVVHSILGHAPLPGALRAVLVQRELAVDRIAARQRIPLPALIEAFSRYGKDRAAMLRFLGCDAQEFAARVLGLDASEQLFLEVCGRICIGYGTETARRTYPAPIASGQRVLMMAT